MNDVVLLDIEGTVSPIAAVRDSLIPYARSRLAEWVRKPGAEIGRLVDCVRAVMGEPGADSDTVAAHLRQWSDADVKAEPLKALQGLIWEAGFAEGALSARFYDDVPPALSAWRGAGVPVFVFSSGSELAQRLWFEHSEFGDLSGLISGYFDITSAGPKHDPESYRLIAKVIGVAPEHIRFFSDVAAELDAASLTGMRTVGVSRPEDGAPDVGVHREITRFTEL